jgi:antitoxin component YwqK of YwqJK toxin-antitoxin module
MKKLLPIIFVLIITSCSPEPKEPEVQSIYLQERGGVYYEVNSTIPFTGKNRTKSESCYEGNSYIPSSCSTYFFVTSYVDGLWNGVRTISEYENVFDKTMYKNGVKDGLSEKFSKDGQLQSRENYKEGKRDGLYESYFNNTQLNWRDNYKDGKKHGLEERYYKNGQLKSKVNFIGGKEDGLKESYHENGFLESKVKFLEGKKNGLSEGYDENGEFSSKSNYKDDEYDGLVRWNKSVSGEPVIGEVCYEKGKKVDMSYCD